MPATTGDLGSVPVCWEPELLRQATVQRGKVRVVRAASRRGSRPTAQRQEGGLGVAGEGLTLGVAWPTGLLAAGAGCGAGPRTGGSAVCRATARGSWRSCPFSRWLLLPLRRGNLHLPLALNAAGELRGRNNTE